MSVALKPFQVTIRCFDPARGPEAGAEEYILPVDSPDEEHAIASTLANAASFKTKYSGDHPVSLAFMCTAIRRRE